MTLNKTTGKPRFSDVFYLTPCICILRWKLLQFSVSKYMNLPLCPLSFKNSKLKKEAVGNVGVCRRHSTINLLKFSLTSRKILIFAYQADLSRSSVVFMQLSSIRDQKPRINKNQLFKSTECLKHKRPPSESPALQIASAPH